MPSSNDPVTYPQEFYAFWERARAAPIELKFARTRDAIRMRGKLYAFRRALKAAGQSKRYIEACDAEITIDGATLIGMPNGLRTRDIFRAAGISADESPPPTALPGDIDPQPKQKASLEDILEKLDLTGD